MHRKLTAILAIAGVLLALTVTGAIAALVLTDDSGDNEVESAGSVPDSGTAYLGLTVTTTANQGLQVTNVEEGGPAAEAGIEVGDYLRSVDGQVVRTPEQLRSAIASRSPGDEVTITYERADREHQARVSLGDAPANAQAGTNPTPSPQIPPQGRGSIPGVNRGQMGVQVQSVTPQLMQRYGLTVDSGVVITSVQPASGAEDAGLMTGDVILEVEGEEVQTAREVSRAILTHPEGESVSLRILRRSDELDFEVELRSAQLFPGFENLPPALQQRLEELARSRNLTPEELQRFARGFQNNLRVGTVESVDATSLVLTPLESGDEVTYTLDDQTQYRFGNDTVSAGDVQVGSRVLVLSLDGETATAVLIYQR
jgi:membrane-associated protease RseP (regulator of RpoE activity)